MSSFFVHHHSFLKIAVTSLVLMTYHGVVLLFSGYQADEAHILRQYSAIVNSVHSRYPDGSLWILNEAKIKRMSGDSEGAVRVLTDGLEKSKKKDKVNAFRQADTLVSHMYSVRDFMC